MRKRGEENKRKVRKFLAYGWVPRHNSGISRKFPASQGQGTADIFGDPRLLTAFVWRVSRQQQHNPPRALLMTESKKVRCKTILALAGIAMLAAPVRLISALGEE